MTKAKKTNKKTIRQGDKCAFVRSLPFSLPASEVSERAAKLGMTISKAYIHNIRSAANKEARATLKKTKKIKGRRSTHEKNFRELVVTLGPARAKKLLTQVETSLSLAS